MSNLTTMDFYAGVARIGNELGSQRLDYGPVTTEIIETILRVTAVSGYGLGDALAVVEAAVKEGSTLTQIRDDVEAAHQKHGRGVRT